MTAFAMPSPCGTVVPEHNGNSVLVALQDGVHRLDLASGTITPVAIIAGHSMDLRFNDGKCSPDGRLFVGSMKKHDPRNKDGNLYSLDVDGSMLKTVVSGTTISYVSTLLHSMVP